MEFVGSRISEMQENEEEKMIEERDTATPKHVSDDGRDKGRRRENRRQRQSEELKRRRSQLRDVCCGHSASDSQRPNQANDSEFNL